MLGNIIFCLLCGFANVARGEKLFNLTDSTVVGRLTAMSAIASACAGVTGNLWLLPVVLAGLMLWCTFAWDYLWSAEIGNDPKHSKLWGLLGMGLRGFLGIYPLFMVLGIMGYNNAYWVGLFGLFQGVPYIFFGNLKPKAYSVMMAEIVWGAAGIGEMLYAVIT